MPQSTNNLGQPVGFPLPDWQAPPWPEHTPIAGRFCRLEPLDPARHAADLQAANALDREDRMWTYLPYGPFETLDRYRAWMEGMCGKRDPLFYAIVPHASGKPVGIASHMRIDPANGVIEVGGLAYSPLLQRTPAATEAMYLMMERAFSVGYRRYEWKCDALNHPSRAAALRLGFTFEGLFRQAVVVKARNRDTAWYSITDREWPAIRAAFQQWLAPANFDDEGKQRGRLQAAARGLA